jgi:prepilin-type N-terminal cleavage/methylation domain-containing protein
MTNSMRSHSQISYRPDGQPAQGFTLVEMAIVLLIVTLLMTGLVPTISSQFEQRYRSETRKQLDEIRDALLGFAVANGRLPCPASTTSNGLESPLGGGVCSNPYDGFVPAATLGITPTDSNGYALDGWSNRTRYAVTISNTKAFTTANGMQSTGLGTLAPDLSVCDSATGITTTTCGTTANKLTNNAVAVIYSVGKSSTSAGIDEAANLNGDQVFVNHVPAMTGATNGEFDDVVTWLSPNILYNRMVAAGKLP